MRRLATDLFGIEPRATSGNEVNLMVEEQMTEECSNLLWSQLAFVLRFPMGYLIQDKIDSEVRQ